MSLDSEKTVLGAILVHPKQAWTDVATLVHAEDFQEPSHRAIFDALAALDAAERPIDPITVADELRTRRRSDTLTSVGGDQYLVELMGSCVTIENVAYHARLVARSAERRRWASAAAQLAVAARDVEVSHDEFFENAEQTILDLTLGRGGAEGPVAMKPMLRLVRDQIQERWGRRSVSGITGVRTGFTDFDAITSGLQPGELAIIAARPSMGKTALAMCAAANAARHLTPTLIFSLEMTKEALVERMVSSEGRINSLILRSGRFEIPMWVKIGTAFEQLSGLPIWFEDASSLSITALRSIARRWAAHLSRWYEENGIEEKDQKRLIVVDFLQLLKAIQRSKEQNRALEVGEIARGLKALAKELRCPVAALSQLNRGVENRPQKRPTMADLRDSGEIEQAADLIAFLYRDEVYSKEECKPEDQGVAEVIIGKQRNGPTATVRLAWEAEYTRFGDLPAGRRA